jgi:hypothetical protein
MGGVRVKQSKDVPLTTLYPVTTQRPSYVTVSSVS